VIDMVRVFINGRIVDLGPGATVADALLTLGGELAEKLAAGLASVTDGRGLELDPAAPLSNGAILRVVVRARRGTADVDS
jgi:hypothetical protein